MAVACSINHFRESRYESILVLHICSYIFIVISLLVFTYTKIKFQSFEICSEFPLVIGVMIQEDFQTLNVT